MSRRYRNRRIGEFLKELDLTEGRATGIPKILKVMAANGSASPMFETDDEHTSFVIRLPVHERARATCSAVTPEVAAQVSEAIARLLVALDDMSRQQLQAALQLKDDKHFRESFLQPALDAQLVAMTQPDRPRSSKQRYRLTDRGLAWLPAKGKLTAQD